MSCSCAGDLANIYAAIGNLEGQFNYITGNTLTNYNQLSRIVSQQSNIYNTIYYGLGNLATGNLIINNSYVINGNLSIPTGNLLIASGDILSTVGNLVLGNGNLGITTGNVTMSSGNLGITAGNVTMSNGNLRITTGNIVMGNGNIGISRGNLILSNGYANINGSLLSTGVSTILGQSPFMIQYGITSSGTSGTVTFDTPYSATPTILHGWQKSSSVDSVYMTAVSATAFTWAATSATIVHWMAIGLP